MKTIISKNRYWPFYLIASICSIHQASGIDSQQKLINSQKINHFNRQRISNSPDLFSGFYLGVESGITATHANTQYSSQGNYDAQGASHMALHNQMIGFFLGYGRKIQQIYMGGEVGANIRRGHGNMEHKHSANFTSVTHKIHARKKNSIHAAARLGTYLNPQTIVYIKEGIALNSYHVRHQVELTPDRANAMSNSGKRLVQPFAGFGIEIYGGQWIQNTHCRIGMEYEHTFGRSLNIQTNSSNTSHQLKLHPASNTFKLRFIVSL